MKPTFNQLKSIVNIGHETSIRGKGISMIEAIKQTNYIDLRNNFDYTDLIPILEADDSQVTKWIQYSEDKRTSGGYYLKEKEIGSVSSDTKVKNSNPILLTAQYIEMELDYWTKNLQNKIE
jgi:hypothetical protein